MAKSLNTDCISSIRSATQHKIHRGGCGGIFMGSHILSKAHKYTIRMNWWLLVTELLRGHASHKSSTRKHIWLT